MASHPENEGNKGKGDPQTFSQDFQIANVSARVPEKVGRGVFSTGALVLQGATEFVLDFILRLTQPHHIATRVVLPINLIPQFVEALKSNLDTYRQSFGAPPPALPKSQTPPPSIEEIYQDLRISDEVLAGVYANSVMITHTIAEFCLEFISNFYPRAILVARVYLSAPHVPVLLQTLTQSWQKYQAKLQQPPPPKPPAG